MSFKRIKKFPDSPLVEEGFRTVTLIIMLTIFTGIYTFLSF